MTWYVELNKAKDKIVGHYSISRTFKGTSFGKNATDANFINAGLYKLVVDPDTLLQFQRFNPNSLIVDKALKTVDFTVEDFTQAEVDVNTLLNTRVVEDGEDDVLITNATQLKALITARPAQIDTYIDNNVTDLASAKLVLATLAKGLALLLRDRFRE